MISTRSPGDIVKHLKDRNPDDIASNVTAENFDVESEKLNIDSQPVTMLSRARALVEENKISFNPKMHIFNVQGTHDVRVVSLYPKEKCSCPSNGLCYHILGVKISFGAKESCKFYQSCARIHTQRRTKSLVESNQELMISGMKM